MTAFVDDREDEDRNHDHVSCIVGTAEQAFVKTGESDKHDQKAQTDAFE